MLTIALVTGCGTNKDEGNNGQVKQVEDKHDPSE